jgi:hypothetical protein
VTRAAEAGIDRDQEKREHQHRGSYEGDAADGDPSGPV